MGAPKKKKESDIDLSEFGMTGLYREFFSDSEFVKDNLNKKDITFLDKLKRIEIEHEALTRPKVRGISEGSTK